MVTSCAGQLLCADAAEEQHLRIVIDIEMADCC